MSSWAKPGVKCVCVDDDFSRSAPKLRSLVDCWPQKGPIYTIRRVREYPGHGVMLLLHEVRNPRVVYGRWDGEPQFSVLRFRPLTPKQQQDVAFFRHLLSPSPADVGLIPAGVELVE